MKYSKYYLGDDMATSWVFELEGKNYILGKESPCLTAGRGDENDLVLKNVTSSRVHATIADRGKAGCILIDHSTNGTLVHSDDDGIERCVKNAEYTLPKSGTIRFGLMSDDRIAAIKFKTQES